MSRTMQRLGAVLLVGLFPLTVVGETTTSGRTTPPRVLVIHSYGTDFQWTRDLDAGIRSVLNGDPFAYANVFSEYLDAKYHTSSTYQAGVAALFAQKYADWDFDALIVTDNRALQFVNRYRDELFGPIPTVFAGINDFAPGLVDRLDNVTGVAEQVRIGETLALATDLFPGGRLFVLSDDTLTSRRNIGILMRELSAFEPPLEVEVFSAVRTDQLPDIAEQMRADDIVLLIGSIVETDGTLADFWRAGTIVATALPAPVFVMWDFFIGTGVAGGLLASGRQQGVAAAELVERILAGEAADEIPVVVEGQARWVFDLNALRPAGVRPGDLPAGAILLNRRLRLWDEYRREALVMAVTLMVLGVLVVLLVLNVRRRAVATARLRESLGEKEILLQEIHHRVKNNLQVISSILSIQSSFISDRQSLDYFRDCEARVQSMALVHERLYQGNSLSRIELPPYLADLTSSVVGAMAVDGRRVAVAQTVSPLSFNLDQAIPVGLVVTELVSNAVKYAYPDGDGVIDLAVTYENGTVTIVVRDHGVGMGDAPSRIGALGVQLVDALVSQLSGSVEYRDGHPGTVVTVRFPWEDGA